MPDGGFDLHVHCAPDVRPRKTNALELVYAARDAGMGGLLLKNHDTPTVSLASTLRQVVCGLQVFGGIALNEAVGGFNPRAVETALRMGAVEVWMPTHSAENEQRYWGHPGAGMRIYDRDRNLLSSVRDILELVAEHHAILGTGHLAPGEIRDLVAAARDAGVKKILITHPEIEFLSLPVNFQREILGPGVFFERCFVRDCMCVDWDGMARSIREVGIESTVLATDLGQPSNPHPVDGFRQMKQELSHRGFTEQELFRMTHQNAALLLGLQ